MVQPLRKESGHNIEMDDQLSRNQKIIYNILFMKALALYLSLLAPLNFGKAANIPLLIDSSKVYSATAST